MKANYSSFIQHIQVHLSVQLINTKYATYHSYRHFGALNQVFLKLKTKLLEISETAAQGVLRKKCSENMQQIYRRTPMLKCYFNKRCEATRNSQIFPELFKRKPEMQEFV